LITITGATGALNGATVDHLLRRLAPDQIVVTVRDPAKAHHLADRGLDVRRADYADPASLPAAFEGADQLLLVSSNAPEGDIVALHAAAIDAAVAAGVGRILYTSHQGAAIDSPFLPARTHAATEALLAKSGVAWTALRNGFYLHSLDWFLGPWRETGVVAVPADGPVSWTSREDAAEAAALILAGDTPHEGPTTLTASSAVTFAEAAAVAAEVSGRSLEHVLVDRDEWLATQAAAGVPDGRSRFLLGMYDAAAEGFFAGVDPLLARLLGREPRTVREELVAAVEGEAGVVARG
jgi:NAD(P)H dehydrogenase (quinone)